MLLDYLLGGIISFSLLVAIHEYGHFIVARLCGVKVFVFSIGFGKKLWSHTSKSGIEFCLGAVPLGGYVKLLNRYTLQELPEEQQQLLYSESIEAKPWWQQSAIVLAGPVINLIFALVLFFVVNLFGGWELKPTLGILDKTSIAYKQGLRSGDSIIEINDKKIDSWQTLEKELFSFLGKETIITVISNVNNHTKTTNLRVNFTDIETISKTGTANALGLVPDLPKVTSRINKIIANSPAEKSNLKIGDVIIAINNIKTPDWQQLTKQLRAHPKQEVSLEVLRNKLQLQIKVMLSSQQQNKKSIGFLGVQPTLETFEREDYFTYVNHGISSSLSNAYRETVNIINLIVSSIVGMLSGTVSLDNLGSPISVVSFAGETFAAGIRQFVQFIAMFSISLGIFNLLPFPMLDGGHFIIYTIEALMRRKLTEATQIWLFRIGAGLIMAIMAIALVNDINRILM